MAKISIRLAKDTDNEQILALGKRCPQEGMISFFVDRKSQFNLLHRLLDPNAWHVVALDGEQVIGLVGVIGTDIHMMGKMLKAGYMLDLRLDTAYRSGTTAYKMIKFAIDKILSSDMQVLLVNFLKDNQKPLVFTSGRGGIPKAQFLGDNRVFNMLPIKKMKLDSSFEISTLHEEDIEDVLELYGDFQRKYKVFNPMSEKTLRSLLENMDGFEKEHFYLAKKNGKLEACIAAWDQFQYKSYQVVKMNTSIKMASFFINLLSPFFKLPKAVKKNEALRQLSLVMYAHGENPLALKTLIRHINNQFRGGDYTMISLYAQENDAIFELVKDMTAINVMSELYVFSTDGTDFTTLAADIRPVHFDMILTQ